LVRRGTVKAAASGCARLSHLEIGTGRCLASRLAVRHSLGLRLRSGLRESSALILLASKVRLSNDELVVRLSVSKDAIVRDLPPAVYRRVSTALPSPLDLFAAWQRHRDGHVRWLVLASEAGARPGTLTSMLRENLARMALPTSGYSSHSLRIGSHRDQVLLNIPPEVRKARFGWGPVLPWRLYILTVRLAFRPQAPGFSAPPRGRSSPARRAPAWSYGPAL
jgi:hypothetical protein